MRAFLAVSPDTRTRLVIDAWRSKAWPELSNPVPAANYHLTLAFLGQINASQQEQLEQHIASILPAGAFSLHFDSVGYFAKPKALWLGSTEPPALLTQLASDLTRAANRSGIAMQKRDFLPHLTLFRRCPDNPPAPLFEANIDCHFSQFHLFESHSGPKGVIYTARRSWSLTDEFAKNSGFLSR